MARLGIFNFTNGVFGKLSLDDPNYAPDITDAFGGKGLRCNDIYERVKLTLSGTGVIYVAFLFQALTVASVIRVLEFRNGSTILCSLARSQIANNIVVYRGGWDALLASGSSGVNQEINLVEVRYQPHGSSGTVQVKINGVLEIDYSGNTSQSGDATLDNIVFGQSSGLTSCNGLYGNIVVDSANWPGDSRQSLLVPTGAGNATQWDVVSGANYAAVDETPVDDRDGVTTNVADEIDNYALSDLPADAAAVVCAIPEVRAWKHGAATPTKVAPGVRVAGADYVGSGVTVPAFGAIHETQVYETNPDTSAAWLVSEVNGAELALKSVS